jgi:hypothetical protein
VESTYSSGVLIMAWAGAGENSINLILRKDFIQTAADTGMLKTTNVPYAQAYVGFKLEASSRV